MFKVPTPTVKKTVRRSLAVSKVNSILKVVKCEKATDGWDLYKVFASHNADLIATPLSAI